MSAPKRRRRWATAASRGLAGHQLEMPELVDGQLTADRLIEALTVLRADGPDERMTLTEVVDWLKLHVRQPHPPAPSTPPGARDARTRRRYTRPAGAPGRLQRTEAIRAA